MTRKRIGISLVLLAWLGLAILAACSQSAPTPTRSRGVSRSLSTGVPTVYGGQAQSWALASTAIPPTRAAGGNQPLTFDCYAYLQNVFTSDGGYTWTDLDNCISAAAGRTVTLPDGTTRPQMVVLTLPSPYMESGGAGTVGDPYTTLYLPAWMNNSTYVMTFTTSVGGATKYYDALKYQAAQAKMVAFIQAAAARYNTNANVGLVRAYVGFEGESQPNRAQAGEDVNYFLGRAETVSTCAQYTTYVQALAEAAYTAFTNKPVVALIGTQPCASYNGDRYRKELYNDTWRPAGKKIGLSLNSLAPDRSDAATLPGMSYDGWYKFQALDSVRDMGAPVYAEYGLSSTYIPDNKPQYMYWSTLAGAATGSDWIANNETWIPYYNAYMYEVMDNWMLSNQRAWVVFRDREWPGYTYGGGWGTSGYPGDYAKNANYLNPVDAPQACNSLVRATAVAANAAVAAYTPTPACASTALPTPAPTMTADAMSNAFNRQARRLAQNKTVEVALDATAWASYYGTTRNVSVVVSYLDWGTDTFKVSVVGAAGTLTERTVTKTNTGAWLRDTWSVDSQLSNNLSTSYGMAYARITNPDSGQDYIHELYVDAGATAATVTPGPSPTPSRTPTATATPSNVAWFTEVFPAQAAGAGCRDFNLRSGCGANDTYIEIRTSGLMSLAGYRIVAGACSYTFPADTVNNGYLLVFADEMSQTGGRCAALPASGTLYLYTAGNALAANQAYSQPTAGSSWADSDPAEAGGTWAEATPSPGE
jgi:hypothetical protein